MMSKTLIYNTFTYVEKYKSVNIHFYISLRATLEVTFTATCDCVLPWTPLVRPKSEIYTPKRDDEHHHPFCMGISPPGGSCSDFAKHVLKSVMNFEGLC